MAFAAAAVGVLIKGPIAFCLPALIILIFLLIQNNLIYLPKIITRQGLIIFLAIISIWYLPMYIMHGNQFLEEFIGVHNILRATVSEHPQYNVWYYYAVVLAIGFLPWLIPLIKAKLIPPKLDIRRQFLIIWAATVFLVFQIFATKYPTYTFPYMLPISILLAEYYVKRQQLFKRLAIGTTIALIIGLFVAIPICARNSGKEAAQIILPLVNENTCVVSYRRIYSGSLVFYSGLKVYRLEESAKIAQLKPHKMSWTAINVMPFMSVEEIPRGQVIAIVDKDMESKFLELVGGQWRLIAELPDFKIMEATR